MPNPEAILVNSTLIANKALPLAIFWHLMISFTLGLMVHGWRPSSRSGAAFLAVPLGSVAATSFYFGNPFNGIIMTVVGLLISVYAIREGTELTKRSSSRNTCIGGAMILFAWAYPHFLENLPSYTYLYGSPIGLLPCPALSLTIGFAFIGKTFSPTAVSIILGAAGLLYGLAGVFYLNVFVDSFLVLGAAVLLASSVGTYNTTRIWSRLPY